MVTRRSRNPGRFASAPAPADPMVWRKKPGATTFWRGAHPGETGPVPPFHSIRVTVVVDVPKSIPTYVAFSSARIMLSSTVPLTPTIESMVMTISPFHNSWNTYTRWIVAIIFKPLRLARFSLKKPSPKRAATPWTNARSSSNGMSRFDNCFWICFVRLPT